MGVHGIRDSWFIKFARLNVYGDGKISQCRNIHNNFTV